jgi:hypothetical protein
MGKGYGPEGTYRGMKARSKVGYAEGDPEQALRELLGGIENGTRVRAGIVPIDEEVPYRTPYDLLTQ